MEIRGQIVSRISYKYVEEDFQCKTIIIKILIIIFKASSWVYAREGEQYWWFQIVWILFQ